MTREEAIARIKDHMIIHEIKEPRAIYISEALDMAIKALEQEPILDRDCEHCSKTYGTLGCCDTVSNEWMYSCKEGQREYLLDKIRAEIEELDEYYDNDYFSENIDAMCKCNEVLQIIDKYKESEDEK